jgi:hypothetical protein
LDVLPFTRVLSDGGVYRSAPQRVAGIGAGERYRGVVVEKSG